jgi:hypothetical protein
MTLGLVFLVSSPLRWPEFALRSWLLAVVPPNSTEIQLANAATQHGWRLNNSWNGHQANSDWGGIDGAKVVWIHLGGYQSIFRADVDSFWAFDEKGGLVDVRIRKMYDGP